MTQEKWRKKIVENCKSVGTYEKHFEDVIDTLSQILEQRDIVHKQWVDEGKITIITHVNKAGEANPAKNPLITLEADLNTQALALWKELCLTPKSFKDAKNVKIDKPSSFEDILNDITS